MLTNGTSALTADAVWKKVIQMRLIDADALKEAFKKKCCCEISLDLIDNAPTVEPRIEYGADGQPYRLFMSGGQVVPDMLQGWRYEERPHGKWLPNYISQFTNPGRSCSLCNKTVEFSENFCPNCGADMRGEE